MGNQVQNAGGLDGVTGWSATSGAARAVDETVLGGPGRGVILATKTLTAGQSLELWSEAVAVTAGDQREVTAFVGNNDGGALGLALEIVDGGGAQLALQAITVQGPALSGGPRRGLSSTYGEAFGRVVAAATGLARSRATSTATASGSHRLALYRPYVAPPLGRQRARWDPGPHLNPDLQNVAAWPATLAPFLRDLQLTPYADRLAFLGDVGIPGTSKLYAGGLHNAMTGHMRLSAEQADALDQFYEGVAGPFFVVRPDTDQLCYAEWLAEGAPRPVGFSGVNVVREVGLHIWVA